MRGTWGTQPQAIEENGASGVLYQTAHSLGLMENGAILSRSFGGIESPVGGRKKRFNAFAAGGWVEDGGAHAACNCERGLAGVNPQVGDGGVEAGQSLRRTPAWNLCQHQQELFSAVATGVVINANGCADSGGEPAQRFIAGLIAVSIVDALELVHVYQRHQQGAAFPPGAVHLRIQLTQDSHAIQHSGEDIVRHLDAQLLTAEFKFAGALIHQAFQFPALPAQTPGAQQGGYQQQDQQDQQAKLDDLKLAAVRRQSGKNALARGQRMVRKALESMGMARCAKGIRLSGKAD